MRAWVVRVSLVFSLSGGIVLAERWDRLYGQAISDLEAGRYEAAITKLEAAIGQNSKSGSAIRVNGVKAVRYFPYFLLGKAHFHLRNYEQATRFFTKEGSSNPPKALSAAIISYQHEMRAIQERERREAFDRAVAAAETARTRGAYTQAAEELEKARQKDETEFEKRDLGNLLATVRLAEKQSAAEAERQRIEAAFQELVRQASEKEQQGTLAETTELLVRADQLIAGRAEVGRLQTRVKEREDKYTAAKEAALAAERQDRPDEALESLKQAEQANPERYRAERLAGWADSLSAKAEIQKELRAGAAALELGQYAEALEKFDRVLRADPENVTAKTQRSRAVFFQLLARGDELAGEGVFPDALEAFELSRNQAPDQGPEVYERMRLHLDVLRARRSPLRDDWLDLMRECDQERFAKERRSLAARPRRSGPGTRPPAQRRPENRRHVALTALNVEPQEALKVLERARETNRGSNAELESWTGVAYARLSFLTADQKEKEELRAKATLHFRRALTLDPQHRLNPRLVPPRILKLFAEARQ